MKNKEIEELLNKMKNCNGVFDYYLEYGEVDLLLSYIEQLEKENDRLKEVVENLTTMTVNGDTKQIKNTAQYKLEQLEKEKKELEERYNLVCKISEERKNKWLSLNEENEILFNTLKKYKLECESNGKIIHQLQNNRDKAIEEIDNLLVYNEFSDTTKGFGNVPEQLKFYLSDYDTLDEFRKKILKGGSDE